MTKKHKNPTERRSYFDNKGINSSGLKLMLQIMRKQRLRYDCQLFSITLEIERLTTIKQREEFELETTGQVINILKHIKDNDLLKVGE